MIGYIRLSGKESWQSSMMINGDQFVQLRSGLGRQLVMVGQRNVLLFLDEFLLYCAVKFIR